MADNFITKGIAKLNFVNISSALWITDDEIATFELQKGKDGGTTVIDHRKNVIKSLKEAKLSNGDEQKEKIFQDIFAKPAKIELELIPLTGFTQHKIHINDTDKESSKQMLTLIATYEDLNGQQMTQISGHTTYKRCQEIRKNDKNGIPKLQKIWLVMTDEKCRAKINKIVNEGVKIFLYTTKLSDVMEKEKIVLIDEAQVQKKLTALEEEINTCKEAINKLETEKTTLAEVNAKKDEKIGAMNAELTEASSKIAGCEAHIANLENQILTEAQKNTPINEIIEEITVSTRGKKKCPNPECNDIIELPSSLKSGASRICKRCGKGKVTYIQKEKLT